MSKKVCRHSAGQIDKKKQHIPISVLQGQRPDREWSPGHLD
jgi:hypothetical protein